MSSPTLQRWGGLSAIAAGALIAAGTLQDGANGGPLTPALGGLPVFPLLGSLFLLGALTGLHARQVGVYGRAGNAGFLLASIGTSLAFAAGAGMALAGVLSGDRAPVGAAILGGAATGLAHLVAGLGLLLLGIATLRAGVLPSPWRLLPMAIFLLDVLSRPLLVLAIGGEMRRGLVLQEGAYAGILPLLMWDVPEVLAGACWALLGYALWSGAGQNAKRPARAG